MSRCKQRRLRAPATTTLFRPFSVPFARAALSLQSSDLGLELGDEGVNQAFAAEQDSLSPLRTRSSRSVALMPTVCRAVGRWGRRRVPN